MKKFAIFLILLFFGFLSVSSWLYADAPNQPKQPTTNTSPVVSWISKEAGDTITIENGTGANLNIVINVNTDPTSEDPAGISVKNCGNTTHIAAGSSAVCITNDIKNPVSFSSDKTTPATGTYQITQQLPPTG